MDLFGVPPASSLHRPFQVPPPTGRPPKEKPFWGPPGPPKSPPAPLPPYQDRFADSGHGLTSGGGGEVDGKIGEAQNGDEGTQPPLGHEFLAVIVRRVVAEDRLHEFHLGGGKIRGGAGFRGGI